MGWLHPLRRRNVLRGRAVQRWLSLAVAGCLASTVALLASGPAQAVACGTAQGFTRLSTGTLYRLTDDQLISGTGSFTEGGKIGTGWGSFAWTGAGGDGVLYALTTAGELRWYRYDTSASAWVPGSGRTIGTGFTPRSKIINISLAGLPKIRGI